MILQPLEALSIGPLVYEYLNSPIDKGKVHSVFQRVINIIYPDDNLWSISRCDISNGVANIVTNLNHTEDFSHYGIEPGTVVTYDKEKSLLQLGSLSLSLEKGVLWKSPLAQHEFPLTASLVKKNLLEVEGWLRLSPNSLGLMMLFRHLASLEQGDFSFAHSSDPTLLLASQALSQLLPGISSSDRTSIEEGATSLIGLGPGLTPSGDDFLAGLLLSLTASMKAPSDSNAFSSSLAHDTISNVILKDASRLTNRISAQMLYLAAQGTGSELMEHMVCALFYESHNNSSNTPSQAAQKLSSVGASSGFDQLLGIISGARLYVKNS